MEEASCFLHEGCQRMNHSLADLIENIKSGISPQINKKASYSMCAIPPTCHLRGSPRHALEGDSCDWLTKLVGIPPRYLPEQQACFTILFTGPFMVS